MAYFSKTVWNNSGDNRRVWLVSDFKGNGIVCECMSTCVNMYVYLSYEGNRILILFLLDF